MVPSPDWFIGIDSFDLCVDGKWLDGITIEVRRCGVLSPSLPARRRSSIVFFVLVACYRTTGGHAGRRNGQRLHLHVAQLADGAAGHRLPAESQRAQPSGVVLLLSGRQEAAHHGLVPVHQGSFIDHRGAAASSQIRFPPPKNGRIFGTGLVAAILRDGGGFEMTSLTSESQRYRA